MMPGLAWLRPLRQQPFSLMARTSELVLCVCRLATGVYSSPETERPVFQNVAPEMTEFVKQDFLTSGKYGKVLWIGQINHCEGPTCELGNSSVYFFDN